MRTSTKSSVENDSSVSNAQAEFASLLMMDLDVHTLVIRDLKDLAKDTAWAKVPTPAF